MKKRHRLIIFFSGWIFLAVLAMGLNVLNINWNKTPVWQGVLLTVTLGVVQGSVLELVVITIATLVTGHIKVTDRKSRCDDVTMILNYNLLAVSKDDIDETFRRMYEAFMGNLAPNVSAVLVSATGEEDLMEYELKSRDDYRYLIYTTLVREGECFAARNYGEIDCLRLRRVWSHFRHLDRRTFLETRLEEIVMSYIREFMCIHRVSRVLRKCGQYQDLIQLSAGDGVAYTYTDTTLYSRKSRPHNQPLFHHSPDVYNILHRKFDYTLVLDGDTGVPHGAALNLLMVATAHPEMDIIQPAIIMDVDDEADTIFMVLEKLRQEINKPVTTAVSSIVSHCSFYGKGLIKNRSYLAKVIGTRRHPIERVPIDVLSHDTFEAAVLKTYFASSVGLLEAPCFNYVSWNIRERRWNKGEVLLSMYFWKTLIGKPMRALQRFVQKEDFIETRLRTESTFDFVQSYIAHSAIRQMFMKPLLLIFILIHMNVSLYYPYLPVAIMLFLVIVFPKFATCTRRNWRGVLVETLASVLQFTPEAVTGTVRIIKAYQANICKFCNWRPQAAVEQEFRDSHPMVSSMKHLWGYSVFAVVVAVPVAVYLPSNHLLYSMLGTVFLLPLYTGLTSLTLSLRAPKSPVYRDKLSRDTDYITWSELSSV